MLYNNLLPPGLRVPRKVTSSNARLPLSVKKNKRITIFLSGEMLRKGYSIVQRLREQDMTTFVQI
jgi:hypothetical protein